MLRTKEDVDRHAQMVFRKTKNDIERKTKCFFIAQLYFKIKEYESVVQYVTAYLTVRHSSSPANKLLAQAYEHLGLLGYALTSYENSLKYDPSQPDLLLKVCELYCHKYVNFNPEKAQLWLEKAKEFFPHEPILFSLKEKLIGSSENLNKDEFEKLLLGELKSKPGDLNIRTKLLRLYVDTNRIETAFNQSLEIQNKQTFNKSVWFECVSYICEAYKKEFPSKCNWDFYMHWLFALDRLCSVKLSELLTPLTSTLNDPISYVHKFDQVLFCASQLKNTSDLTNEFMSHMSGQLAFHLALLVIKHTKKECSGWSEAKKIIGTLLLFSIKSGLSINAVLSTTNLKDSQRKSYETRVHHGNARYVQAGYTLLSFVKEVQGKKQFLDLTYYFTAGPWRMQVFQKLFSSIKDEGNSHSYFLTSNSFKDVPQKLPSSSDLKPSLFVPSFEVTYPGNLHYLIWLGLHALTNSDSPTDCKISKSFHTSTFKLLNFTTNNLSNYGTETLNQLDMDSFLYLTLFCNSSSFEEPKANGIFSSERPVILPADVTNHLCTEDQAKWWKIASKVANSKSIMSDNEKVTNARFNLQKGLEVVRGENLSLPLIIHLARTFANRMEDEKDEIRKEGCEKRALYLWDGALPSLKGLSSKVVSSSFRTSQLFHLNVMEYSQDEIGKYLDEGRYFVACYYMKCRLFEKALDIFKLVNTPESIFKQALIYEKMASELIDCLRGDEITSELRSRQAVLATKARDCLQQAKVVIKMDHPLYHEIKAKTADIDQLLCRIEPENGIGDGNGCNISEGSLSFGSGDSPVNNITPSYHHSNRMSKHFPASTPKHNHDYRFTTSGVDFAELLAVHQSTNQMKIQQVLDQSRLVLDQLQNITFEQKNQRSMIDDLCSKLSKLDSDLKNGLSELKKEVKKPDLYNMLDDEEYTEDMLQYPYFPQRGLQGNNTVTYGAPLQQYFSPNQIYPGNVFGGQGAAMPFGDGPQVADYLRSLAAGSATGGLRAGGGMCLGLQQPPVPPIPNLTHLQVSAAQVTPPPPTKIPVAPTNVVITTSDTLPPVSVPVSTPTLSVTIPPEHRLGSISTTPVPHKFQIPMPSDFKLVEKSPVAETANEEIKATLDCSKESDIVEHDPLPNFKPIIPLPDEVEVKTGEENEVVMFDIRAKLFRFVNKEWKERGLGQLKILKNEATGRFRILMRREQVHKVCANHFITDDMNLIKLSDKAWMWWAHDFADEKVEVEKLSAKFKTSDDANRFKNVFDEVKLSLKENKTWSQSSEVEKKTSKNGNQMSVKSESVSNNSSTVKSVEVPKPSSILSPPKFLVPSDSSSQSNKTDKVTMGGFTFLSQPKLSDPDKDKAKKEEKKVESPFANFSFGVSSEPSKDPTGFIKTPLLGTPSTDKCTSLPQDMKKGIFSSKSDVQKSMVKNWNCPNCSFNNQSGDKCASCSSPYNSSKTSTNLSSSTFPTVTNLLKSKDGSWDCSHCSSKNNSGSGKCAACNKSRPESVGAKPSLAEMFKPKEGSWSCPECCVQNTPTADTCVACTSPRPGGTVAPAQWSCPDCYSENPSSNSTCAACSCPSPLSSGKPKVAPATEVSSFSFGTPSFTFGVASSDQKTGATDASKPTSGGFTFGANQSSPVNQVFTFGSSGSTVIQPALGTQGSKFSFTMAVSPVKSGVETKSPQSHPSGHKSEESENSENEDVDHTEGIMFQPVVDLPDKIEVKTGEEDEEVIYCHRAKLFRFDNSPGQKQWKERGTGDIKILRHSVTGKLRLLMRREPIMKLCLNHYITKDLDLKVKDNRSWSWFAPDFADNEFNKVEDAIQHFCVRFKTPEVALEFKEAFENAQKEVSQNKGLSPTVSKSSVVLKKPVFQVDKKTVSLSQTEDNDCEVVYESTISDELKQKALALQLPPYFYLYENLPKCPGCRGCELDSDTDEAPKVKETVEIPGFSFGSSPIFGIAPLASPGQSIFGLASNPKGTLTGVQSEASPQSGVTPGGQQSYTFFGSIKDNQVPSVLTGQSLFGDRTTASPAHVGFSFGSVAPKPSPEPSGFSTSFTWDSKSTESPSFKPNLFAQPENTLSKKPSDSSVGTDFSSQDSELSFSSLAKTNSNSLFNTSSSDDFKWDGAGSTIFGGGASKKQSESTINESTNETDEGAEEGNDQGEESEQHDPHFEPIVPLPDKIELKTGEEDEQIVFSERGKLYRMDAGTKEWKERGIGVMKLLRHQIHNTYRLLMRREQVYKIVCNHLVTPELKINKMKNSETSWCWYAMNMSQEDTEPVLETLCIKFKNNDISDNFKGAVDAAQKELLGIK